MRHDIIGKIVVSFDLLLTLDIHNRGILLNHYFIQFWLISKFWIESECVLFWNYCHLFLIPKMQGCVHLHDQLDTFVNKQLVNRSLQ